MKKKLLRLLIAVSISSSVGANAQTTNYVGKFNSSGSSVNSSIFDNGTGVGIGTNAPAYSIFDVRAPNAIIQLRSSIPGIVTGTGNGGAIYFGIDNANNATAPTAAIETSWGPAVTPQIGIGVTRDGLRANMLMDYSYNTYFRNGTTTNMFINSIGNIGIGTTSPVSRLTLGGTNSLNPNTGPELDYNGESLSFQNVGSPSYTLGNIKMVQRNGYYIDAADMVIQTSYGALFEKMRITGLGNVGIGTSAPDEKLTVNGTIHSTEVKVTSTVPVPDYVFKKTYKLRPLQDVQQFITQNKHLPEIPSAGTIEQNGLKLGEMNMLLLKKVEELTLYLIDQKKEITKLKSAVLELKKSKK